MAHEEESPTRHLIEHVMQHTQYENRRRISDQRWAAAFDDADRQFARPRRTRVA